MMSEKIELVLVKRKKSKADLARDLNTSSSNIYNKIKRDNWSESELIKIAEILDCTYEANLILNDTKEKF